MFSSPPKIIVIGGNAAGPGAAAKAKRVNPDADILMIEVGEFISTGTCELPYLLEGKIDDYKKLVFFDEEKFYQKKGVKVLTRHRVESINRNLKSIQVTDLNDNSSFDLNYDKLILTTGSKAKKLPGAPVNSQNLFSLKSIGDYLKIRSYLDNNKVINVLVFGAGFIGIETAEAFKNLGCNVTLIEKENYPLPFSDIEISRLTAEILSGKGIRLIGGFNSARFFSDNDKIKAVNIDGRIIESDIVISAIGFEPNVQLAVSSGIKTGVHKGIITDSKLRTNDANIFAAGDNCEVKNFITGANDYFPLATIAHEQGHIAGANAAGDNLFFEPVVKNIAVKIFDKTLVTIGITGSEAEKYNLFYDSVYALAPNLVSVMPESEKTFGKLIYEKRSRHILGGAFIGNSEVIGFGDLVSALIKSKQNIDFLSRIDFNYTPPRSPFINILSILGRKAKKKL